MALYVEEKFQVWFFCLFCMDLLVLDLIHLSSVLLFRNSLLCYVINFPLCLV